MTILQMWPIDYTVVRINMQKSCVIHKSISLCVYMCMNRCELVIVLTRKNDQNPKQKRKLC